MVRGDHEHAVRREPRGDRRREVVDDGQLLPTRRLNWNVCRTSRESRELGAGRHTAETVKRPMRGRSRRPTRLVGKWGSATDYCPDT